MNFDHLDEFLQHQKGIRDREGNGLLCKLHHFSKQCTSKFYCADRGENGICNYNRMDELSKRKEGLIQIIIYYSDGGIKIDI